mmetsp:Transcript_25445/g.73415  ORF Transcript_25445/g.73415 Transcript_25445/m.73415 type:complete len:204 (-) Transcript_25445:181-792(-)
MGVIASVPGAAVSAVTSNTCCASRSTPVHCKNQRLKSHLLEMGGNDQAFEEVWVFRDIPGMQCAMSSFNGLDPGGTAVPEKRPPSQNVPDSGIHTSSGQELDPHMTIIYMYDHGGLRPLRLDWHSDGLCFADGGKDSGSWANLAMIGRSPGKEVRLKVFKAPVNAWQLLNHLKQLEPRVYDAVEFNSKHFCEALFAHEDGIEY